MNTEEIIAGCKQRNRNAQKALFETYKGQMYALCCRYAKSYAEAEDMLQEGFIKAFRHIDSFQGNGSFAGWLSKVFINQSISAYHRHSAHNSLILGDEAENKMAEYGADISAVFASETLYSEEEMLTAIQQLPPHLQTIFNMVAIDDYAYSEVATALHLSNQSVKTLMYRARTQIKKHLLDQRPL